MSTFEITAVLFILYLEWIHHYFFISIIWLLNHFYRQIFPTIISMSYYGHKMKDFPQSVNMNTHCLILCFLQNMLFMIIPGCFEGPEKTMEVVFKPNVGADDGLRSLSREQLDFLCTQAKCTILSKISNSHIDAYVLSESSMFIYKTRFIMKTCGTTTLLRYEFST